MFRNKAFQRAMHSLAHPLAITAALVLLLNALVFQPNAPSWWTGKIGDAAWLLFAPFLVAALLAWLIPARWKQQEQIVGIAALTIAGFGFAAVKTIPAFNALVADSFRALTGYPAKLSLDPTDLLALPSLVAALWLWNRAEGQPLPSVRPWLALGLAVLALVADTPAPQRTGIQCLSQSGSRVWAFREIIQANDFGFKTSSWEGFSTEDGGLNWSSGGTRNSNPCIETAAKQSVEEQRTGNRIVSNGGNTVEVITPDGTSKTVTMFQY